MVQPQGLYRGAQSRDYRVDESDYFGAPLSEIVRSDRDAYGLRDQGHTDLYRVSYVYQRVFKNRDEYGGIQARARTFLHLQNGGVPTILQRQVQRSAHRAATLFNTGIETPAYETYLDGFASWENGDGDDPGDLEYENWEVERVTGVDQGAAGVGAIDWSLEIYLDEQDGAGFTGFADLSGLATGTTNPWRLYVDEIEGEAPVDIPPTKWTIGWEQSRRRGEGEYYVRPEPGTDASKRYGFGGGAGKTVYINGKPIGSLDQKARTWLSPEYGVGDGLSYRGNYSREGLVEETSATYQALRKGGRLYQTGETEEAVYLTTARAKPENWQGADPDSVPIEVEARSGSPSKTRKHLEVIDPADDPLPVSVKSDDQIIKHLGKSTPPYQHHIAGPGWNWPGFRSVEEYGGGGRYHPGPDDDEADPWADSEQSRLGGYGGDA